MALEKEELMAFHKWLLILIALESMKICANVLICRSLSRGLDTTDCQSVLYRYLAFLISNVWMVWLVYGNVLYFNCTAITDEGNASCGQVRICLFEPVLHNFIVRIHRYGEILCGLHLHVSDIPSLALF